mgnify:CR=1 FL=1
MIDLGEFHGLQELHLGDFITNYLFLRIFIIYI